MTEDAYLAHLFEIGVEMRVIILFAVTYEAIRDRLSVKPENEAEWDTVFVAWCATALKKMEK